MGENHIKEFLAGKSFAVVGASRERFKYGNKVLRCYIQHERKVFPVNPHAEEVEGLKVYPDLKSLPEKVDGISVITPPEVSQEILRQAAALGIKNAWLQPGAESETAMQIAEKAGMNLIAGGPCVLVVMGFHDWA